MQTYSKTLNWGQNKNFFVRIFCLIDSVLNLPQA